MLTGAGTPITWNYSLDDALEMTKKYFEGKDVDYYLVEQDVLPGMWVLFVDAQPELRWEHECYLYFVHKEARTYPYTPTKQLCMAPPEESLTSLDVKIRHNVESLIQPEISTSSPSRYVNEVAGRNWAVIISGGISKNANYPRYWNDCSSIYQTLIRRYGIPKDHITVIMSDGKNPAADMIDPECENSTIKKYISSPLDLDGDGLDDIELEATRTNILTTIRDLADKVEQDDHVFIFVADHGGRQKDPEPHSYICLWGMEENGKAYRLNDDELAEAIQPLLRKSAIVNIVLGQCFSGGFIDHLKIPGCVVAASTTSDEEAYSTWEHSKFLNNWIRAINDDWVSVLDEGGQSKYDFGLEVTMNEAFKFAFEEGGHSPTDDNRPVYISTPELLGATLAFDKLPPEIDLFIKDNKEDVGDSPNITTDIFYDSPSIWVRNEDDNVEEHDNPVFEVSHRKCFVYVRVHNRGRRKYEGGKYLHMYWAKASLNFSLRTWTGQEKYNDIPTGGHFGGVVIPPIEAGSSVVVPIEWDMTQLLLGQFSNDNERHHYCLLAAIKDYPGNGGYDGEGTYQDVQGLKTQAQKNLTIIYRKDLDLSKSVYVRNAVDSPKKYSLEIRPRTSADESVYSMADIEMELSQPIYSAWVQGGTKSVNVSYDSAKPMIVKFTSPESKIDAVSLSANQFEKVALKFNFRKTFLRPIRYTLDLIQRDETGQIVGGEAFIVEAPLRTILPVDIGATPLPGSQFGLTVNSPEIKSVTWFNSNGEIICNDDSVTVSPTMANYVFRATALTNDGELATGEISLQSQIGIESLSPVSAVGDRLEVVLRTEPIVGDKLLITDVNEADCQKEILLQPGGNSTVIDTSTLRTGLYAISYLSEGKVVDSKKFTKK